VEIRIKKIGWRRWRREEIEEQVKE